MAGGAGNGGAIAAVLFEEMMGVELCVSKMRLEASVVEDVSVVVKNLSSSILIPLSIFCCLSGPVSGRGDTRGRCSQGDCVT